MILMGSKEYTLQSNMNKGDLKGECCQTIFRGVVSRDTIVVRSRGFLASPRKSQCSMVLSILESIESMKKTPMGDLFHW